MIEWKFSDFTRPAPTGEPLMLRFLSIQNLAVIDTLALEFTSGLNVLTGETGAGKSILVEAVGLLLGARATPDLVRTGADIAAVQAVFDGEGGEDLILRREVSSAGRTRGFVNGALATAANLREVGAKLVDLHGQHEHQALLDPASHLHVLDQHAGLIELRDETARAFDAFRKLAAAFGQAQADEREKSARAELAAFQLGEIDRARLRPGEDEELLTLRQLLSSAERVRRLCDEGYALLYESDQAVLANLSRAWKKVEELAALDPKAAPYLDGRATITSQLDDVARFLRGYGAGIDASPARLQEVEDRLALIERLKRKYGPTLGDVVARGSRLRGELAVLESIEDQIATLSRSVEQARAAYLERAGALSEARRAAAALLSHAIEKQLGELALERCRFEVRFSRRDAPESRWTADGVDEIEFFLSLNPGEDPRPLARIVSGGELSRIMLALKTLASTDQPGKSLVFDEVDAGIGGRVADAVGNKLKRLGSRFQVLCITHLPQIAAYGDAHFHISKRVKHGRTVTDVSRLDRAGRVDELARMLAGAQVSDRARATARELLAVRWSAAAGEGISKTT
jgi:DNA repair protein RecN (Recombination protein N)